MIPGLSKLNQTNFIEWLLLKIDPKHDSPPVESSASNVQTCTRHGTGFIIISFIYTWGVGVGLGVGGTHHTLRYRIHGKNGDFGEGWWST